MENKVPELSDTEKLRIAESVIRCVVGTEWLVAINSDEPRRRIVASVSGIDADDLKKFVEGMLVPIFEDLELADANVA